MKNSLRGKDLSPYYVEPDQPCRGRKEGEYKSVDMLAHYRIMKTGSWLLLSLDGPFARTVAGGAWGECILYVVWRQWCSISKSGMIAHLSLQLHCIGWVALSFFIRLLSRHGDIFSSPSFSLLGRHRHPRPPVTPALCPGNGLKLRGNWSNHFIDTMTFEAPSREPVLLLKFFLFLPLIFIPCSPLVDWPPALIFSVWQI